MSVARKPCLIFGDYQLRLTDGGPSGFLAQNIAGHQSSLFHFQGPPSQRETRPLEQLRNLIRGYPRRALARLGFSQHTWLAVEMLAARKSFIAQSGWTYDWVWFHDIYRVAASIDLLRDSQKVILQPHTPEPASQELRNIKIASHDIEWTLKAERAAFGRADVCVLPNEGIRSIFAPLLRDSTRVEYLASGCRAMVPRCSLPLDPTLIYYLFLGRRLPVKGFDIVLDAFQRAYDIDRSLRLLIVGDGDRIDLPGVIDVGRSGHPADWIGACDYLVSANRQSYFDLSVMEALSLGTPLIIACTGGHSFFLDIGTPGLTTLPTADAQTLAEAMLGNRKKRDTEPERAAAIKALYDEVFSDSRYRIRLESLLDKLIRIT